MASGGAVRSRTRNAPKDSDHQCADQPADRQMFNVTEWLRTTAQSQRPQHRDDHDQKEDAYVKTGPAHGSTRRSRLGDGGSSRDRSYTWIGPLS